jgi:hypothetical protein
MPRNSDSERVVPTARLSLSLSLSLRVLGGQETVDKWPFDWRLRVSNQDRQTSNYLRRNQKCECSSLSFLPRWTVTKQFLHVVTELPEPISSLHSSSSHSRDRNHVSEM